MDLEIQPIEILETGVEITTYKILNEGITLYQPVIVDMRQISSAQLKLNIK